MNAVAIDIIEHEMSPFVAFVLHDSFPFSLGRPCTQGAEANDVVPGF